MAARDIAARHVPRNGTGGYIVGTRKEPVKAAYVGAATGRNACQQDRPAEADQ
ncbi:hypothetical protein AB395_00001309 [Sinorhizobium fredii CCBAU 45436]|nr:hypothetical protein AB395_00001309 [Sinorhizobium fredii CCBAU 45436]AWM24783.1 hypothetical protein AOX55_00001516 [Sinorhizobium fredii CCBAU 25509]